MALTPGTRLGVYDITAQIGEGGMGQVYRATDTTLGRQVAMKILPDAFASDPERLARFEREAKTLASLNHPKIAAIYGFEKSGGLYALVMELVEGDDLSQRIARGAIPIEEALPIAKQIAEALEAAHEQNIIHRDLKPANIKVRADGQVKVLDFGLAKAMEPTDAMSPSASMSPTITTPAMMTGVGMILGTAAYMSPEQARGKTVDKRADIWAFGCVLFEMLAGARPFDGEDIAEVLGAVVRLDPNWAALPTGVPPLVRTLLQSCLVKDPRHRVTDISVALFVLEKTTSLASSSDASASQARIDAAVAEARRALARVARRRVVLVGTATLLATAVVATTLTWIARRPADPVPPRVSRLPIAFSSATALSFAGNGTDLAITPDGSRVVYVGNNGAQLFVRALDALEPVALYTGSPFNPFVSPDGQWIGFRDSSVLKKVAVTGGPAITVATLDGVSRGATWGPDDSIIFATSYATTGLQRVSAAGGSPTVLTRPDAAEGEADHFWPEFLPGGRAVLFTITALTGGLDAAQVAVLDLQTGTRTVLVRGGSDAHYVRSGHLVYAAAGTLRAVGFDLAHRQTRGTPVPVVPAVATTGAGGVDAVVADDGTLAYVSGGASSDVAAQTLVWVDRQGHDTPIPVPARAYVYPRLSPDGTRVAVEVRDQEWDIWIANLASPTLTRFTFGPTPDRSPVWTPDGRRIIWASERSGLSNLYGQAADGSGAIERLTQSDRAQYPFAISPDGTRLVIRQDNPSRDLMVVAMDPALPTEPGRGQSSATRPAQPPSQGFGEPGRSSASGVRPLIQTPAVETDAEISPDGHWIAYQSDESGRDEIYVRPFPEVNSGRWQVSTGGGAKPLWARNGRELFYLVSSGRGATLMRAPVTPGASFTAGTPTKVLEGPYFFGTAGNGVTALRTYDVSPDGQRFLMIKLPAEAAAAAPSLIVVQHFDEELKRLVPTK